MLHKCANPNCASPFRRLEEGKLFQVELEPSSEPLARRGGLSQRTRASRHVERFWLCDKCCLLLTLSFERGRGVVAVPLRKAERKNPAAVSLRELPLGPREIKHALLAAQH